MWEKKTRFAFLNQGAILTFSTSRSVGVTRK